MNFLVVFIGNIQQTHIIPHCCTSVFLATFTHFRRKTGEQSICFIKAKMMIKIKLYQTFIPFYFVMSENKKTLHLILSRITLLRLTAAVCTTSSPTVLQTEELLLLPAVSLQGNVFTVSLLHQIAVCLLTMLVMRF